MITVDSATYSSYEAPNLQNVEFFDSNGSVIPSWLESGDSNSSSDSIYWLNLGNGIPANSSITINMGFAPTSINLFNPQMTGEAPELSKTYGEYDDGRNIFKYYNNFGNSTSGWVASTGVAATASDGLTINFSQNGYFVGPSESIGTAFDSDVTLNPSEMNIGYINTNDPISFLGGTAWESSVIRGATGNIYPVSNKSN